MPNFAQNDGILPTQLSQEMYNNCKPLFSRYSPRASFQNLAKNDTRVPIHNLIKNCPRASIHNLAKVCHSLSKCGHGRDRTGDRDGTGQGTWTGQDRGQGRDRTGDRTFFLDP